MKIHIDPRDLKTPTSEDTQRVQQLVNTAFMLAGNGAGAAQLLLCAYTSLAEVSDKQQELLEVAIGCITSDLAELSPEWAARVQALDLDGTLS